MPRETSEETIQRVLSDYHLGRKLRQLRLRKKLGLVDLGKHSGLSASMLSQLENGKLVPTLPTLARIAMVFDVGLDFFFTDRAQQHSFEIVRAADRIRFPDKPDAQNPAYFFECLAFSSPNKGVQAYMAEFPSLPEPAESAHMHDGQELVLVLEGKLIIRFGEQEHELESGDCAYFDSAEMHGYRGLGETGAKAVVVTTTLKPAA